MKTVRLLSMLTMGLLVAVPGLLSAQSNAPGSQGTTSLAPSQAPPRQPGLGPVMDVSKLTPTGLADSGGSYKDGIYSNSIYNISLKIPVGWVFAPVPKQMEVPVTDKNSIAKHMQVTRVLMIATENAPMKRGNQRKSIQVVVTQLRSKPGPGAELDFITYSENAAKEKGMKVEYLGNPEEVRIQGHKYGKIRLTDSTSGATLHVEQYVSVRNQTLLQFLLVSPDDAGLDGLQSAIQSLKFPAAKRTTKTPAGKSKSTNNKPATPN